MKINIKSLVTPAIVLFIIAALTTALLAGTNLLTKDKIAELELKTELEAVEKVTDGECVQLNATINGKEITYYKATKDGQISGYVFKTFSNGYGGLVSVITGFDADGVINGAEILNVSDETPGLGQNAAKPDFYQQFSEKTGELQVVKNNAGENEITAVTGATITSTAVVNAVNEARTLFEEVTKGESSNE